MNCNELWAAAQEKPGKDPESGALFVIGNGWHNRIKILYFGGTAFAFWTSAWASQVRFVWINRINRFDLPL